MQLRRAALWAAGVMAIAVAAAAIALLSFDLDSWRREAAGALSARTGRSVTFDGPISLSLSLQPKLRLEGVALGNPPGMSRLEFARIERLEAEVRLWPLLRGRIEIARLAATGADVLLERDAEGRANWTFPATERTETDAALPRIDDLLVERSAIAWRGGSGAPAMRIERLTAQARDGIAAVRLLGGAEGRRIEAEGRISGGPSAVRVQGLVLRMDDVAARGELALELRPPRPKLGGTLAFGAVDLDFQSEPAPRRDGRIVPDLRLDAAPLDAVDLDLLLTVERLRASGVELRDAAARLELADGRLALREASAGFAGGRLTAEGEAGARRDGVPEAKLRLDLARAEFAELAPGGPLTGRFDLKAELGGAGRSLRALVAGLAGEARLLGRDGRIAGRALDLAAADLVRLLAPWSERGADTTYSCMLMATTIRQGRAQADALALDADRVLVTGEGVVDLGRERLDLKLTPRPKEASLFSLATPVNVRGSLFDPSVSPDEAGLLRGAAGALLGNLVLPGAGFLLPFVSAGAGDHPCAATLSAKPGAAPRPARDEGGVGGFFRGLGRSIDRTLGIGR